MSSSIALVMMAFVLIVIFAVSGIFFIGYLRKLNIEKDLDISDSLMGSIEDVVRNAVIYINQTVVDHVKAKNEQETGSHKLTDEQQEEIFNKTKELILSILNSSQIDEIMKKYIDVDEGIAILIEKHVKWQKNN